MDEPILKSSQRAPDPGGAVRVMKRPRARAISSKVSAVHLTITQASSTADSGARRMAQPERVGFSSPASVQR